MNQINHRKVLIIIPSFNAGEYLEELLSRIRKSAPEIDLLVIDDGSSDNSAKLLDRLQIRYHRNKANMGKGYSLQCGFVYALDNGYDFVITMDADLQHLPEEIDNFLEYPEEADLYLGTRKRMATKMPFPRRLSNFLTSRIISWFSGQPIRDSQCGFRMISSGLIKSIKVDSVGYDFESEFLFKAGKMKIRIAEVPVSTVYCNSRSSIKPITDTLKFVLLIWKRIFIWNC